jgi:hypothetical protein
LIVVYPVHMALQFESPQEVLYYVALFYADDMLEILVQIGKVQQVSPVEPNLTKPTPAGVDLNSQQILEFRDYTELETHVQRHGPIADDIVVMIDGEQIRPDVDSQPTAFLDQVLRDE